MKKIRFIAMLCAMLMLIINLTGCMSKNDQTDTNVGDSPSVEKLSTRINLGTATTGSLFYSAGIALTQLWIEDIPGTSASATASSGSKENLQMLDNKEANMAFLQSDVMINAYTGKNEYEGKPMSELRILAPVTTNPYHMLVRKGSGIESLTDVRGKNVVVGSAGGGTYNQHLAVLGSMGITFDDINASNIGQAESIEAMRNGLCDFTIVVGQYPFGVVVDALTSNNIELLYMTQSEVDTILSKNSWLSPNTIPAETYEGQTKDYPTIAHNGYICVSADFPEEDAYLLTKSVYSNTDKLIEAFNSFDSWALNNPGEAAEMTGVPLHAGSERALKELGLIN